MVTKHLTEAEAAKIANISDDRLSSRDRAIVRLLLNTGIRVGELCKITLPDCAVSSILIRGEISKTRLRREVPLNSVAAGAVRHLYSDCSLRPRRCPVTNNRLIPLTTRRIQQIISKLGKGLSIPFSLTPHKLRHTFATRLMERGVNIRVIQELLGHTSLTSTQIYTAVTRDTMRSAVYEL